jgi:hypothetical protein
MIKIELAVKTSACCVDGKFLIVSASTKMDRFVQAKLELDKKYELKETLGT